MKGRSSKNGMRYKCRLMVGYIRRIVGYNTDKHKDESHFHKTGEKTSIDVKRFLADNYLFFGDLCPLRKASSSEVSSSNST